MIICARKADIGKTTFCKVFHQKIIMYRLPHFLLKGSFKLQDNWYSILWFALSRNGSATFPIFTALSSKCEILSANGIAHISISLACEMWMKWEELCWPRTAQDFQQKLFCEIWECADKHIKICCIRVRCNQASHCLTHSWPTENRGLQLNSTNALVSVWTDVHRDKIHKTYSSTPPFHKSWENAVSVIWLQCSSTTTQTQNLWWK